MKKFDIIIIGAGKSGCLLAQYYASKSKKVLVIEERNHIAGNSYHFLDRNGSLMSKYVVQETDTSLSVPTADCTQRFQKILDYPYIDIMLNTDYFDIRDEITGYEKFFFTEL